MSDQLNLSKDARSLLRMHFAGHPLSMQKSPGIPSRADCGRDAAGLSRPGGGGSDGSSFHVRGGTGGTLSADREAERRREELERQDHWYSRSAMQIRRAFSLIGKAVTAARTSSSMSARDAFLVLVRDYRIDAIPQAAFLPKR